MELFILLALVGVVGFAVWKFNKGKGKGFDVNNDGKVNFDDVKAAAENTVSGVKETVAKKTTPAKKPAAKKTATTKRTTATKKPAAKKPAAKKPAAKKTTDNK